MNCRYSILGQDNDRHRYPSQGVPCQAAQALPQGEPGTSGNGAGLLAHPDMLGLLEDLAF